FAARGLRLGGEPSLCFEQSDLLFGLAQFAARSRLSNPEQDRPDDDDSERHQESEQKPAEAAASEPVRINASERRDRGRDYEKEQDFHFHYCFVSEAVETRPRNWPSRVSPLVRMVSPFFSCCAACAGFAAPPQIFVRRCHSSPSLHRPAVAFALGIAL